MIGRIKMKKKRSLTLILILAMLFTSISVPTVPVHADEALPDNSDEAYDAEAAIETGVSSDAVTWYADPEDDADIEDISCDFSDQVIQNGGFPKADEFGADKADGTEDEWTAETYDSLSSTYKYWDATNAAAEAIRNWNGTDSAITVSLGSYLIPSSELSLFCSTTINNHPEFFYLSGRSNAQSLFGYLVTVSFEVDPKYSRDDVTRFNSAVSRIVNGVDSSWTDLQKVMYIHDYLALHIDYDQSYSKYNAYNAIVEESAVCQGYSLACTYLLNRIDSDFDCGMITSNAKNHAWNALTLNGRTYYMDITHDDPVGTYRYHCRYKFFLVSEATLYTDNGHMASDWMDTYGNYVQGKFSTDSGYESVPWKNMGSVMPMFGNTGYYYANNIELYKYNFKTGTSQRLQTYNTGYSAYTMGGLASYGEYIVFTLPKRILIIDQNGVQRSEYPSQNAAGLICGARVENNVIRYDVYTNGSYQRYEQVIEGAIPDAPVKVSGVKLNTDSMVMQTGDSAKLKVTVIPENADDKTVVFTSSSPSVATIDENGNINALAEGNTIITVKTAEGGYTASVRVTVKVRTLNKPVASTGSGDVEAGLNVLLSCDTYGVFIYYTEDGSDPAVDANGNPIGTTRLYTEAISVKNDMTVKAVAVKTGYKTSDVSSYSYRVKTGWGGIDEQVREMLDNDISKVPSGMWYVFDGENKFYTKGGNTGLSFKYTGEPITFGDSIRVFYGTERLVEGRDYSLKFKNNINSVSVSANNAPYFTIKGIGNYSGSADFRFAIKAAEVSGNKIASSGVKVACLNKKPQYTGNAMTLKDLYKEDGTGYKAVTLYTESNGKKTGLIEGVDYDVNTDGLRSVGSSTLVFELKNNYTGIIKKTITVKPYNLTKDERNNVKITFSRNDKTYEYCKSGVKPSVTVTAGDYVLREGIDYTLSFKNNKTYPLKNGVNPMVVVKGKGNYKGKRTESFAIEGKSIESVSLIAADKKYKKDAGPGYFKVYPKVMDGDKALTKGKDIDRFDKSDFTYYYAGSGRKIDDNEVVAPGTLIEVRLSVSCPSTSRYKGATVLRGYYRLIDEDKMINKAEVIVEDPDKFVFANGTPLVPLKSDFLSVKLNGKQLENSDYAIVSATNNRFVGTATVVLEGRGEYGGTKKVRFRIKKRFL